jgi:hypothetical protein
MLAVGKDGGHAAAIAVDPEHGALGIQRDRSRGG